MTYSNICHFIYNCPSQSKMQVKTGERQSIVKAQQLGETEVKSEHVHSQTYLQKSSPIQHQPCSYTTNMCSSKGMCHENKQLMQTLDE